MLTVNADDFGTPPQSLASSAGTFQRSMIMAEFRKVLWFFRMFRGLAISAEGLLQ